MTKKTETKEDEGMKTEAPRISLQNLLAVLLLLSLLANAYFIVQAADSGSPVVGDVAGSGEDEINPSGTGEVVESGMIVELDYVGSFTNGSVFDTSLEDEARKAGIYMEGRTYESFSFVAGSGQVITGFDNAVLGMQAGEEKTVTIPPEEAYSSGPLAGETLVFRIILRSVKEPKTLNAVVINDKRCRDCDISPVIVQLQNVFPGLEYREVDYGSEEGKKIYTGSNLTYLPAILFDESVKEASGYKNVEMFLEPAGDYLSLKIGAEFDPTAEICDNDVDDNGDGLTDCEDPDCASTLICNKDAITECVKPHNISADTVVFYHTEYCGHCQRMKPWVKALEEEGYSFYSAEGSDAEAAEVVDTCLRAYMDSNSVPQFICVKNGVIHVGAFRSEEGLKQFADDCAST